MKYLVIQTKSLDQVEKVRAFLKLSESASQGVSTCHYIDRYEQTKHPITKKEVTTYVIKYDNTNWSVYTHDGSGRDSDYIRFKTLNKYKESLKKKNLKHANNEN